MRRCPFEELHFARGNSAVAVALAWLARGSPESQAGARAAIAEVEAFCADTGYLQTRFDPGALAAADLLRRGTTATSRKWVRCSRRPFPPVPPADMLRPGPELTGRVFSSRWPVGGPPDELLGPSGHRSEAGSGAALPRTLQRCGKPLSTDGFRGGRPAKYCGGACRTAHRARHRTARKPPLVDPVTHAEPIMERMAGRTGVIRCPINGGVCLFSVPSLFLSASRLERQLASGAAMQGRAGRLRDQGFPGGAGVGFV